MGGVDETAPGDPGAHGEASCGRAGDCRRMLLRFGRDLTVGAWEAEFRRHGEPSAASAAWPGADVAALDLDLTRVEFVDFGALVRTLLVLDAAVRAQVPATLLLPTPTLTYNEQAAILRLLTDEHPEAAAAQRRMKRRARKRGGARDFMRVTGFLSALNAPHWPPDAVRMLDAGTAGVTLPDEHVDDPSVNGDAAGQLGGRGDEWLTRTHRVLPLRWLSPPDRNDPRRSEQFLALEAGLRDLGLSRSDSHAISQTILAELIENVAEHAAAPTADAPRALVGAMLLEPEVYAESRARTGIPQQHADLVDHALDTNSRALQLLVGDSGVGLIAGRGPGPADDGENQLRAVLGDGPAGAATAPVSAPATASGARGFTLVSRMVGSYRGHVSVRTCDLVGDLVFGSDRDRILQVRGGYGRIPGTLLEAVVLTGSQQSSPAVHWEGHPAIQGDHALHWLSCALDPEGGVTPTDLEKLGAMARLGGPEHDAIGVVVTVPVRETLKRSETVSTQHALRRAICAVGRIVGQTAAAIVFPDADGHLLDLCISGLYCEDEEGTTRHPDRPILVCGMSGKLLWCGGTAPLRAVLEALTAAGGILSVEQAQECWTTANGTGRVEDGLSTVEHLLTVEDDSLVLCLSPRQVMRALTDAVRNRLTHEIATNGQGVLSGRFRFPSLHVTDRWINAAPFIEGTVGFDVAAFTLARAVEATMAALGPVKRPLVVAQAASCPPQLATRLSECLSVGGRSYPMASELDRDGWPTGGEVPNSARVVLCADLICTENTVRRAAAAIVRNAEPAMVVCIVDGRENRGPIKLLNWVIPVVSLCEAALEDTPVATDPAWLERPIVDIDPVSRRPAVPRPAEPQLITEDEILDWCVADPGTLRLGHIERDPHIHFSAYLQVDRLLRRPEARSRITDIYLEAVEEGLAKLDGDALSVDPMIEVWHPGEPDDYAGGLAKAVHARLGSRGHPLGRLVSVQRIVAGNRWQTAPVALEGDAEPRTVVIVDWGALTTTTLHQMILRAADSGARAIIVVVLLNQLPAHDQGLLGKISAVSGDGRTASIVVRFIANSSIGDLPLHSCALCATRTKYGDVTHMPERLRHHVEVLQELLRPRNREELFQTASVDLFSVPISGEDVADYLRWRGLLQRALRDTGLRQTVVDMLRVLTSGRRMAGRNRSSLIRLLAAEQQWLKLPPLRLAVSRDLLAEICVAELRTPTAAPPWFRAQAVMVLSAAAPEHFVTLLPNLLGMLLDEPVAVNQLCVDCYRLVRRPVYDSPVDLAHLRDRLLRCRDDLEQLQSGSDRELIDGCLQLFSGLIYVAERPTWPRPRTTGAQAAWARLREDLCQPVIRHRFEAGVLRVRDFLEDLQESAPSAEQRTAVHADWDCCARQIEEFALVHLPELAEILTGDYVLDQLGKHEQGLLVDLARNNAAALCATTELLFDLLHRPWRPEDRAWLELRAALLREVNWWHCSFLATHRPGTELPAYVVQLVQSAPVVLGQTVSAAVRAHSHGIDVGPGCGAEEAPDAQLRVFCPDRLLEETVGHVLDNIRRHRIPDSALRLHVEYRRPSPTAVVVVLRNSGTRPSHAPGHGLRSLAGRLRPFGGFVRGREAGGGEWTFETEITLQRWQGA